MTIQLYQELYIGLLSGTSVDSIDVAVCSITESSLNILATHNHPFDPDILKNIQQTIANQYINIKEFGELNRKLGILFADAVNTTLKQNRLQANSIAAIGFHGQTIFHNPEPPYNFSWQLGCPNTLIEQTKIPVITDFRQRDMMNGGQGAPLAPLFHEKFFKHKSVNRAIVNIGGISNISLLLHNNSSASCIASDLGPGNTLLDLYYRQNHPETRTFQHQHQHQHNYDYNGSWAETGQVNPKLLELFLADAYFNKAWPKSTGREYFNLHWLENNLAKYRSLYNVEPESEQTSPKTIQRTLLELSARLISDTIRNHNKNNPHAAILEVYLCGGGAHNQLLLSRISELLNPISVNKTDALHMPVDWVEAALFAWLAYCTWNRQKLNLKHITGNKNSETMLGCVYY